MKFDFNDILIEPKDLSDIDSRKEITCQYEGRLPIFAAPMDTVIDEKNVSDFTDRGINVCLPRGIKSQEISQPEFSLMFESYGLSDVEKFVEEEVDGDKFSDYVLIDIANGHMKKLYDLTKNFKEKYPEKTLMVGNVANPKTYELLSLAGADYIRVGIGNGAGCLTSKNTGVGYPMASLIKECYEIKLTMAKSAKIVADGGFKEYADIIKALLLGADYVMLGSVLNKSIESSGDNYFHRIKISKKFASFLFSKSFKVTKKFRGMSTKEVQRKWGKSKLTTSEGVVRYRPVEYYLHSWVENFEDYLKSSMSYTGCYNLDEFIGCSRYNMITNGSFLRFDK